MDELKRQMQGTNVSARIKVTNCMITYEGFRRKNVDIRIKVTKEREMLEQTFERYCSLLNELRKNGMFKNPIEINFKYLKNLSPTWKPHASNIIQNKPVDRLDIYEVFELLIQNEEDVLGKKVGCS